MKLALTSSKPYGINRHWGLFDAAMSWSLRVNERFWLIVHAFRGNQ